MVTQIMLRFRWQKDDEESRFRQIVLGKERCQNRKGHGANPAVHAWLAFQNTPSLSFHPAGPSRRRSVVTSEGDDVWQDNCQIREAFSDHGQEETNKEKHQAHFLIEH